MKPTEDIYLQHILDAIERIDLYVGSLKDADFMGNPMAQDAVIRQLEIIGEAVKYISSETRQLQLHIPWKSIAGMRDKLIHGYFSVNLADVWITAQNDLVPLKDAVHFIQDIKSRNGD